MATPLDKDTLQQFLAAGTRTAKLACVKADGSPLVSPVWFILDQQALVFTTMNTSLKYKRMRADPRVSICVENDTYPYGFSTLQCTVQLQELSPEELLPWATRIAARYVPAEQAQQFGQRNAVEGEVLVRASIDSYFAFEGVAE
jgi:PPOX class probable F420-dependent enzyme